MQGRAAACCLVAGCGALRAQAATGRSRRAAAVGQVGAGEAPICTSTLCPGAPGTRDSALSQFLDALPAPGHPRGRGLGLPDAAAPASLARTGIAPHCAQLALGHAGKGTDLRALPALCPPASVQRPRYCLLPMYGHCQLRRLRPGPLLSGALRQRDRGCRSWTCLTNLTWLAAPPGDAISGYCTRRLAMPRRRRPTRLRARGPTRSGLTQTRQPPQRGCEPLRARPRLTAARQRAVTEECACPGGYR